MTEKAWKRAERWWALRLGGERVPVTGRGRGDVPDVEHPRYALEVKYGRVLSPRLTLAMEQAVAASIGKGKTPMVCVTHVQPGRVNRHYVMLRLEDWAALTGDEPREECDESK